MEICRRRIEQGELDHELIWLSISVAALALSVAWLGLGLPWPHCPFLTLTGHPCLTCGATRGTLQFLQGHFLAALRWNPLVFIGLCALIIFDLYAAAVLIMRWPRLRLVGLTNKERRLIRWGTIAVLALNWIYLLTRSVSYAG